ncbi:hypothetical protein BGZ83_008676 [Gryganskiella cystojenkinii]|nr:hypothetical protein BGZ83_008676 [Gryganskiella cystojenkinii]
MRRSFRRLHASLRPDAVLFLGDLNDGGRGSQSQVFEDNLHRFYERVFETKSTAWNQEPILMDAVPEEGNVNRVEESGNSVNVTGQYRQIKDIPETAADRETLREAGKSLRLYVAGNHDVGFGDTLIRPSMVRYKKVFGSVNYEIEVGNHTLVVLDTLSLSSNNPEIRQESQSFLNQMEQEAPTLPRILFTHVPLFRADTTYCGDVRETKQLILNRGGFQFWNMVNAKLSREILRGIQPDVVFSGDDHDWCEIAHSLDGIVTPEVTLRSFSFAQGIQQPAFVMLSLFNPDHTAKNTFPVIPGAGMALGGNESEGTSATVTRPTGKSTFVYGECMLPNQMMIYMSYGAIFVITVGIVMIQRHRCIRAGGWTRQQRRALGRLGMYFSVATTSCSTHPQSHGEEEGDIHEILYQAAKNRPSRRTSDCNCNGSKSTRPLLTKVYWKLVMWDVLNIAMYAIPAYIVLFMISIL